MSASKRWATAMMAVLYSLAPAEAQDVEVVRVEVDLITVNVSVTDGERRPVTGLRAGDFRVTDGGRPVELEFFDGEGPASIVFVVDASESMKYTKWKKLRGGLKKFLSRAREGNDYTLVAFADRPRLVAESVSAGELWQGVLGLAPDGDTALYDALLMGLEALGRAPRRHKALVLLSDGQDVRSRAALADVRAEALSRRATVYAVGITSDDTHGFLPDLERKGRDTLRQLAAATGGLAFFPGPDEIGGVLNRVNTDVGGQYTLGYYAADKTPGWRSIRVSLAPAARLLRLRYQERYLRR